MSSDEQKPDSISSQSPISSITSQNDKLNIDSTVSDRIESERSLSTQLIELLELDQDQADFLQSYEDNYGRDSLQELIVESIDWSDMKPYPDEDTNPDPT